MQRYRWRILADAPSEWIESDSNWGAKRHATQALYKIPGNHRAVVQQLDDDGQPIRQWVKVKFAIWKATQPDYM